MLKKLVSSFMRWPGVLLSLLLVLSPAAVLADVEITSPSDGATVGGIVPVVVSYSGTLQWPVFYLTSGLFGWHWLDEPALSGSYTYYWDTSYIPNGTEKGIYVYAFMAGSISGTSQAIWVTVYNPYPVVIITSPTDGAVISPETSVLPVTLEYHNLEPNYHGIRYISFVTSGNDVRRLNLPDNPASGSYTWNLDIRTYPLGDHWILAYCEDTSGKGTYTQINFTKATPSPQIPKDKQITPEQATVVAEPINVANGNMFTTVTDISIPAREFPLELSRTYNSQDDFPGSFGYGWRSNFDITLTEQPDNSVIEVDEKGVYTIYTKNPDSTYTPSAGKYSQLTKNPDNTYTLLRKHGRKLYFNIQGLLTRIEERNSNAISVLRDSQGIITEVSDSSGRKFLFISNSEGKTTQVTDPKDRVFKYVYNSSGNLIKTTNPLNRETAYTYDADHNLIKQTDSNNHSLYFEYDSSDRAYHSWQDNNNNEVTLFFDPLNKTTTTTDSLGNTTHYEYNDYGLVTKITDNQGNTQLFSWDGQLNKTSATNQNGNTATFTYDLRGNLLTIKDSSDNITTFTYEPDFDLVSSITDGLGNTTEYSYGARGNLVQVKDSLNNITAYSYDAQGQLLQAKDANNHTTNFSYDAYGNLIQITDALNNTTNFSYDILGNAIQVKDAQGNTAHFTYGLLNRLIKITYPDTSQAAYTYDAVGNLISFRDQNNNVTTYGYDAVNRLTRVTDALGNITQYTYDTEGNRTAITDANSYTTQYFYDSLNRLIKILDPLNNQTLFTYDPAGNLISRTDPNGNTINYTYDALNRLVKKQYPDSSEQTFTYDAKGNMLTTSNPNISYSFTYNPLGQLLKVIDSNSQAFAYAYDPVGNRIQMTTPEEKTITYNYDPLNRLSSLIDIYGQATAYTYDSLGRRINTLLPSQATTSYDYDDLSNLLSLTNKAQTGEIISSYTYEYDKARNRLTKTEPDLKTAYTYDILYRLLQATPVTLKEEGEEKELKPETYSYDPAGNRLSSAKDLYSYNNLNQLLTANNYTYEYDKNGNLIKKTEIDDDGKTKTFTFSYDFENRLTQVLIQEDDEAKTVSFKYDPLGRRIEKSVTEQEDGKTESKTITYVYDNEDIILEYHIKQEDNQTKEETIRYTHGPGIDEPISIEQDNQIYHYHYDGLGSVTSLSDSTGKTIQSYTYDSFGNLERHGNKTKNRFTYTGREYDKETGLYYYRNRYYDPKIGRFFTQDPIGMIDGPNLYTYVNNNPVNWFDPYGLDKQKNKITGWWPRWLDLVVPGYRAYGGPSRGGPGAPEDLMDVAFQRHDIGYRTRELEQADLRLLSDLTNLPVNPREWGRGVNPIYAVTYRAGAYTIFSTRLVIIQIGRDIAQVNRDIVETFTDIYKSIERRK